MNRRDVIRSMGVVSLHALFPSILSSFASGRMMGNQPVFFDKEEQHIVRQIIDVLLPATATPSASEAGVHFFLDEVFEHCLTVLQKRQIKEGLAEVRKVLAKQTVNEEFVRFMDDRAYAKDEQFAWFKTLKQYTLIGYFTSMEGTTRAGDYQKMSERYVGEIEIDEHTTGHSKTFLKFYF